MMWAPLIFIPYVLVLGLVVYAVVLGRRMVRAAERIADALENEDHLKQST